MNPSLKYSEPAAHTHTQKKKHVENVKHDPVKQQNKVAKTGKESSQGELTTIQSNYKHGEPFGLKWETVTKST